MFFSSSDSFLGDSLVLNQANRGSLRFWLAMRDCSAGKAGESSLISGEGDVSRDFSNYGRNLGYILELQRGCPFETLVCSLKSGTCLGMRDNSEM